MSEHKNEHQDENKDDHEEQQAETHRTHHDIRFRNSGRKFRFTCIIT